VDLIEDVPAVLPMPPHRERARRAALIAEIQRPSRRPRRRMVVAIGTATAMLVLAGYLLGSNDTPAYASWTAVPYQLGREQTAAAGADCARRLASARFPLPTAMLTPRLAEQRGKFSAVLLAGPGVMGVCVTGDHTELFGQGTVDPMPAVGKVVLDAAPGPVGDGGPVRMAFGRVTADVAKVRITAADGRTVTSSVGNGFYLAWWPSGAGPKQVDAIDPAGQTVQSIHPSLDNPSPVRR
jgi:hypothetical protein